MKLILVLFIIFSIQVKTFAYDYKIPDINSNNEYNQPISSIKIENPDKYILDYGDVLRINILSKEFNLNTIVQINEKNDIFLTKIGIFNVKNLNIDILKKQISNKLKNKIKDFEISISIYKTRSIHVNLTGYFIKQGKYKIEYGTSLYELLSSSNEKKNIPKSIYLNNKKIDIYDFLLNGNINNNPILQNGDIINMPYPENKVFLSGNIIKSDIYEFDKGDKLSEIIKLAGGFNSNSDLENINILKNGMYEKAPEKKIINFKKEDYTLQNGDIIFIPEFKSKLEDNLIHIYGQVNKQGSINYKNNMKISDAFKNIGGANFYADLKTVKLIRNNETLYINLEDIIYNADTNNDIILEPNDIIFVPEKFFNFRTFTDITSILLSTLGIVSLVLSFVGK